MKDMTAQIAKLRDHAADCTRLSGNADTEEMRQFYANLNRVLTSVADRAERLVNGRETAN